MNSLLPALLALLVCLAVPCAHGAGVLAHGFVLDDKHRLQVEQLDDAITIKLLSKDRAPGGPYLFYDPKTGEEGSVIRQAGETVLARLRAEVIVPAAPNYVSNPGSRYRITVQGVAVAPGYARIFEVDAADALDAVTNEIAKLYGSAHGIQRDALFFGVLLAMRVLNETDHLPARLPLTTLRSRVGQLRIRGQYLERAEQGRVQRFSALRTGREFGRVLGEEPGLSRPDPERGRGAAYGRGARAAAGRETPYLERRYRAGRELEPPDHRAAQFRGVGDPGPVRDQPGRPGRPLTVPEQEFPAIDLALRENLGILMGEVKSPMELRAERAGQPPIRATLPKR